MSYDLGDLILIQGEFRDPETAGSPRIDPTTVTFKVKTPSAVTTSYVYGTDDEVVRSSLGVYTLNISADEAETWFYRIESTGTGQAAAEGTFDVKVSSTDGSGGGGGGGGGGGTGATTTVTLDEAILPDGITLASASFGYVTDGARVTFFGQLTADGTSDGSTGDAPFLPLTMTFPTNARAFFAVDEGSPPTLAPTLAFPHTDGLYAEGTLSSAVHLGAITFAGTVA